MLKVITAQLPSLEEVETAWRSGSDL